MKRLVVNADDLGRSSPVNQGILQSHREGIVTSASLMTEREGFDEAVQLAKAHPRLGIGLHLDLDSFFHVQHGSGRLLSYIDPAVPLQAIVKAVESQIQKAQSTGLPLSHLDGHHHVHLRPELVATIAALAAKYKIHVVRYFRGFYEGLYPGVPTDWIPDLFKRFGLRTVDTFFAGWEPVDSSLPGYRYLDLSRPFETAELMVHPGLGESWREKEMTHCRSPKIREALSQHGIQLATFAELP